MQTEGEKWRRLGVTVKTPGTKTDPSHSREKKILLSRQKRIIVKGDKEKENGKKKIKKRWRQDGGVSLSSRLTAAE